MPLLRTELIKYEPATLYREDGSPIRTMTLEEVKRYLRHVRDTGSKEISATLFGVRTAGMVFSDAVEPLRLLNNPRWRSEQFWAAAEAAGNRHEFITPRVNRFFAEGGVNEAPISPEEAQNVIARCGRLPQWIGPAGMRPIRMETPLGWSALAAA